MQRVVLIAGLAAGMVACATKTPGTAVTASDFDLNPLVGEWRGNYSSAQTGRTGNIAFTLRAGQSSASGNVVIIPRPDSLLTPEEREMLSTTSNPGRTAVSIHFIRKEGGNVNGTLDPYRDPDCDCRVTTTFQGTFSDARTIEGTYTTVPSTPGSSVTGGKWKVIRVRKL